MFPSIVDNLQSTHPNGIQGNLLHFEITLVEIQIPETQQQYLWQKRTFLRTSPTFWAQNTLRDCPRDGSRR